MGTRDRRRIGPTPCAQPNPRRGPGLLPALALLVTLLVTGLVAGCTVTGRTSSGATPHQDGPLAPCPEPSFEQIAGRPPGYLPARLDAFDNSGALCGGLWVPRTGRDFVPQGLAVRGHTAWISGYDDRGPSPGDDYCRVTRLDLRTGTELRTAMPVGGPVGANPYVECRHAGGLMLDEHGLWVVESQRMWLLDPDSFELRRSWRMLKPVQGSFGVLDDRGRLGLGRFRTDRPHPAHPGPRQIDWIDLDTLFAPGLVEISTAQVAEHHRIPRIAQGGMWGTIQGRTGLWLTLSDTRCGVLVGPGGRRYGFVPGAEGIALAGEQLWTVSESTARGYFTDGGRPVVPALARMDTSRLGQWSQPSCTAG